MPSRTVSGTAAPATTPTTTTAATPPQAPNFVPDRAVLLDTHESDALMELFVWIEAARLLQSQLSDAWEFLPDFRTTARKFDMRVNDREWGSEESEGLRYLLRHMKEVADTEAIEVGTRLARARRSGHWSRSMNAPLLFQHDDGRSLVALPGSPTIAGDPAWHRVGPVAVEVDSTSPRRDEIWDCPEPEYLISLMNWIEKARHTLDRVSQAAGYNAALREALKLHEIRYMSPPWEEYESEGLCYLLNYVAATAREQSTGFARQKAVAA